MIAEKTYSRRVKTIAWFGKLFFWISLAVAGFFIIAFAYATYENIFYGDNYDFMENWMFVVIPANIVCLIAGLVVCNRLPEAKRQADEDVARFLSRIAIEWKLFFTTITLFIWYVPLRSLSDIDWNGALISCLILGLAALWLIVPWLLWSDLRVNKVNFFKKSGVYALGRLLNRLKNAQVIQIRILLEFVFLFLSPLPAIFFFCITIAVGNAGDTFGTAFCFLLSIGCLALMAFPIKRWKAFVGDLGRISDTLAAMQRGDFRQSGETQENAICYQLFTSLSTVQTGFQTAVEHEVQAERMRTELIQNVSHDLKTPLTSIIGYVELLGRREDLPADAQEHIAVLAQKSARLKVLIQDLFDLSKSVSKSAELQLEALDLVTLTEQVLSERDQTRPIKTKCAEKPLTILADGGKLSRCLHNLLDNAEKYSLDGTRIYLDVLSRDNTASFTLKNVSATEMTFTADEITERFTRGDASRTAEGAGLGLAICKSFVEEMEADFRVDISGDVFTATITFPKPEVIE